MVFQRADPSALTASRLLFLNFLQERLAALPVLGELRWGSAGRAGAAQLAPSESAGSEPESFVRRRTKRTSRRSVQRGKQAGQADAGRCAAGAPGSKVTGAEAESEQGSTVRERKTELCGTICLTQTGADFLLQGSSTDSPLPDLVRGWVPGAILFLLRMHRKDCERLAGFVAASRAPAYCPMGLEADSCAAPLVPQDPAAALRALCEADAGHRPAGAAEPGGAGEGVDARRGGPEGGKQLPALCWGVAVSSYSLLTAHSRAWETQDTQQGRYPPLTHWLGRWMSVVLIWWAWGKTLTNEFRTKGDLCMSCCARSIHFKMPLLPPRFVIQGTTAAGGSTASSALGSLPAAQGALGGLPGAGGAGLLAAGAACGRTDGEWGGGGAGHPLLVAWSATDHLVRARVLRVEAAHGSCLAWAASHRQ